MAIGLTVGLGSPPNDPALTIPSRIKNLTISHSVVNSVTREVTIFPDSLPDDLSLWKEMLNPGWTLVGEVGGTRTALYTNDGDLRDTLPDITDTRQDISVPEETSLSLKDAITGTEYMKRDYRDLPFTVRLLPLP